MRKASFLFKSVMNKGKNMFKPATTAAEKDSDEEDDDLIEIKQESTSTTFSRHISSLMGSKILKENSYLKSFNADDPQKDLDVLRKALSASGNKSEEKMLFSDHRFDQLDAMVNKKSLVKPEKMIEFVIVVSFHHQVGSQVEFIYPPINEDIDEMLSTEFIRLLAWLALPDGSHLIEAGYVNFILQDTRNTFHCVSCYR